jgi:hypothetical protein
MTEEEIEDWVEKQIDKADRLYTADKLDTEEYNKRIHKINHRANEMYQSVEIQTMTTTIADPLTASLVEAFDNIQNNNWTIEDYFKFQNRIVSSAEFNGYKKGKKVAFERVSELAMLEQSKDHFQPGGEFEDSIA